MNSILTSALKYASQGLLVFPVYEVGDGICACEDPDCKSKGKHPRTGAGGLHKASSDPERVKQWWNQWPNANIGARTGDGSSWVVLDVDDKPGKRGLDSLLELGFDIKNFSMVNRTGSGGYHVFFKYDGTDLRNRQAMMPGLDLRASGGYVVMPPSTHASGDVYSEISNNGAEAPPVKLLELFREKGNKGPGRPKKDTTADSVCEGNRDNYLLAFAGKLHRYGLTEDEIRPALSVINQRRCNPPKAEEDIERLARNACKYPVSAPITPGGAALYAFIQKSKLIVRVDDATETLMVDFDKGIRRKIDRLNIEAELGEQAYRLFRANQEIRAWFDYTPQMGPLFQDQDDFPTFNLYVPPQWKRDFYCFEKEINPVKKLPEIYDAFFRHLTDGHQESFEYLIDWMAQSLQGRNETLLTAIGEQGIGKGTLGLILRKLHGEKNFSKVRDTVFKEKFNARLKNKTLIYVDEIDLKTKESQDRIKDVANSYIEVEGKGTEAEEVANWGSYYLSSNSLDAVKIEAGDRRYSVIQLTDTKLIKTPFMNRIAELMDDKHISELARFLYFKKVEHNMFDPFRSERFEQVRGAGLKDWEDYVIEVWCPKFAGKSGIALTFLQNDIKSECKMSIAPARWKLEELARKYAEKLRIYQKRLSPGRTQRWVDVF